MGDYSRKTVLKNFSTQTIWFERFVRREDLQVGIKSRTDQAISTELMKLLIDKM